MQCSAFVPASLSHPDPIPSAHSSLRQGQPAEKPGKRLADKSGSGPPSPAHGVKISPAVGTMGRLWVTVPGGDAVPRAGCAGRWE